MADIQTSENSGLLTRPKEHRENRKKNRGRKVEDNQAQAVTKFIRVPPRKARLVLDEVRGRYADEALAFLRFIPNRAAGYISKTLASAVANAANNHGLNPNNLKVVTAFVDEGPRMKRVQPRAQGRAYRILKRMSHITVIVEEVEPRPRRVVKKAVATGSRAQAARQARQTAPTPAAPANTAPAEVEETAMPVTTEVAENTAPTENTAAKVTTDTSATETTAPQTANPSATDEIGAPDLPETNEAGTATTETPVAENTTSSGADLAPQTADIEDKTDEIGAPVGDADTK